MEELATNSRAKVAVVDDEPILLESWREVLGDRYEVVLFSDPLAAGRYFEQQEIDVALLDIRMPGMSGLSLLEHLKRAQPSAEAIVVTGHGTVQTAVQAMQSGAYDFLSKPVDDIDAAIHRIEGAVGRKRLREVNSTLQTDSELVVPTAAMHLIGDSRALKKIRSTLAQIADSNASVLLSGESGTGKELAARLLHLQSSRREHPFVAVNCAALTDTLIDSELFGHERGAFTGAVGTHKGLFEAADKGVLFLDEIGEVPTPTQVRLLRVLQEGEIRPVGATKSKQIDARVVAATNANLERSMREGKFREDLYYRISTFRIEIPPLRQRKEDVPLIAQHILTKIATRPGRSVHGFSDDALNLMMHYDWPGNVRELYNAIEHATTLAKGDIISINDLPTSLGATSRVRKYEPQTIASISSSPFSDARTKLLEDFEERYLRDLMETTQGNLSEASRRSGIDRSNLRRMLKRRHLETDRFRE